MLKADGKLSLIEGISVLLAIIRNKETSTLMFRETTKQIYQLICFEMLKSVPTLKHIFMTGNNCKCEEDVIRSNIAVVKLHRAGDIAANVVYDFFLPLVESSPIPIKIQVGDLGISRMKEDPTKAEITYCKLPEPLSGSNRVLIPDPMLATGGSLIEACKALVNQGYRSEDFIFGSVISAPEGIERLRDSKYTKDAHIITCSIDQGLNEHKYIEPGAGDYGYRLWGIP